MHIIANLIVISNRICQQIVYEDIIDILTEYLHSHIAYVKVPVYYARWLVLLIIGNIAAESEDIIELLINSELLHFIHSLILDKKTNYGLFTEYIYLISNLVFSASAEQVVLLS